jgi:hypothetical protein
MVEDFSQLFLNLPVAGLVQQVGGAESVDTTAAKS